jgi:hypothetical protein
LAAIFGTKKDRLVDRQVLIDRLLESENLTDNLEDEDANDLIKWGIAQIDRLLEGINDDETAWTKITHLTSLMRQINSIAGNPSTLSPEKLLNLLEQYTQTFDKAHQISEDERKAVTEKLSRMQPGEAMKYLLEWMHSKKQ